jgi:hypothetical protein
MEKFLAHWRQDALNKAQYEAAIFIGDKLLALTSQLSNPFDSFFHAELLTYSSIRRR